MNFENMTNKEIRSIRNKLAIERQKNKKVVSDREYKQLVRKRERQVSQAKMQLYVFAMIFSLFGLMIFGETAAINFNVLIGVQISVFLFLFLIYLVFPKMNIFKQKRILSYRIRFLIPGMLFFYIQLNLYRYNPSGEYGNIDAFSWFALLYCFIGIPIVMIQNWLEKRVYEEREKDVFQKFSWNDWYSEKIFEYEHMSNEQVNEEIEKDLIIDKQIRACNQELKARKLEARLTDGGE